MQLKNPKRLIDVILFCISAIILILTMLKATNLLTGEIPRRENPAVEYSMVMGAFPENFTDLINYLNKDNSQQNRILWLPLNFANYIIIPESANSKGVFLGTSFLRDTTLQRDYPGFFNLGLQHDSIKRSMLAGDYIPLCKAIRENNINFLIINNYLHDDIFRNKFKSFFSYKRLFDIYEAQQSPRFLNTFLGNKIISFGKDFDLYHIHPNLQSERIEVYEGEARFDSSNKLDWCSRPDMGKLMSSYSYDSDTKSYTVNASVMDVHKISIIVAENLGYRYRLVTKGLLAEQVKSIEYKQVGPQFIVEVTFKNPASGVFIGRLSSTSMLEKNMNLILGVQVLLLLIALLIVLFHKQILKKFKLN